MKGEEEYLFSGEFWTGNAALEVGLIDGIETDLDSFVENKFGEKVKIVQSKQSGGLLTRLFDRETAANILVAEVMDQLEERMSETYWMGKYR